MQRTDETPIDIAIVGAGPYGLSLASQLRARGVPHRIFGPPMQAWRSMSPGMYLKSLGFATSLATPDKQATLTQYCRARGLEDYEPIEIATFAEYGLSVQQRMVPYLEETMVTQLEHRDGQFDLTLASGDHLVAGRVVVAVGLSCFERIPSVLSQLPRSLVSHTSQHSDFSSFAGRDVTVVGAGQSALQAAALLHEHGAHTRVVARDRVHWGGHMPKGQKRSVIARMRLPSSVLGHGRDNWMLQHFPQMLHYAPTEKRLRFTHEHLGPSGAWWLRDRVDGKFPVYELTSLVRASAANGLVCLHLAEAGVGERVILTDHVIAGTGYDIDVDRLTFISPELARRVRRSERAPRLSRHFESSVRGLYFIGPASAASFGPLFRFVAGTAYTAPAVARHLARKVSAHSSPSGATDRKATSLYT